MQCSPWVDNIIDRFMFPQSEAQEFSLAALSFNCVTQLNFTFHCFHSDQTLRVCVCVCVLAAWMEENDVYGLLCHDAARLFIGEKQMEDMQEQRPQSRLTSVRTHCSNLCVDTGLFPVSHCSASHQITNVAMQSASYYYSRLCSS